MTSDSLIRYSVVVPFFNEQENIPPLYMKLTEVMDSIGEPYELVFVDDGSKDDTFKVLSEIYEHDRRVNLVRLRRNFGQTAGLKAGFDFARGEVIVSMDGVIASVKRGGTISAPLAQAPIFPAMVTNMVGVGEETGALDAMLGKVADFYDDQVEASVKALTSIMEPVMIIVIGGIVGFIVVSMYMPLFTVYNSIK